MKRTLVFMVLLCMAVPSVTAQDLVQPIPKYKVAEVEAHSVSPDGDRDVAQSKRLANLDAYIRKSMADWQVPGLAIAVIKDDQIVFLKVYAR